MQQIYITLFSDIQYGIVEYLEYKFQYYGRVVAYTIEICKDEGDRIDIDGSGHERYRHKVGYKEKFRGALEVNHVNGVVVIWQATDMQSIFTTGDRIL